MNDTESSAKERLLPNVKSASHLAQKMEVKLCCDFLVVILLEYLFAVNRVGKNRL